VAASRAIGRSPPVTLSPYGASGSAIRGCHLFSLGLYFAQLRRRAAVAHDGARTVFLPVAEPDACASASPSPNSDLPASELPPAHSFALQPASDLLESNLYTYAHYWPAAGRRQQRPRGRREKGRVNVENEKIATQKSKPGWSRSARKYLPRRHFSWRKAPGSPADARARCWRGAARAGRQPSAQAGQSWGTCTFFRRMHGVTSPWN